MMKKILITNSTCIQDNIGGASRSIHEISLELSKYHKVELVVPNRNNKKEVEKINTNYKIIRYSYNNKNKLTKFFSSIKFFILNRKKFDKNYDLVLGQSPEPFLYLMLFSKLPKLKNIIYTFHGPWYEEYVFSSGKKNLILKKIIKVVESIIIHYTKTIHFQSNYIYEKIEKDHSKLSKKNLKILNILINPDQYKGKNYFLNNEFIKPNKLNLFIIRRLTPRTGVLNFLKHIQNLDKKIIEELNIMIAGTGTELSKIIKFVEVYKLNNTVNILGEVSQELADDLISKSHYTVMPSVAAEGFGVTVLESLYQGTEVLFSNHGGMKEFLSNEYSDNMFNPNNFKDVETLLSNKIETIKANKYKKSFRTFNSKLDFKRNIMNLVGFNYEE